MKNQDNENAPVTLGNLKEFGRDLTAALTASFKGEMLENKDSLQGEMKRNNISLRSEMKENNILLQIEIKKNVTSLQDEIKKNVISLRDEMKKNNISLRKEIAEDTQNTVTKIVGDAIDELAVSVAKNFNSIDDKFINLEKKMDTGFQRVDVKLSSMHNRIIGINNRIDDISMNYIRRNERQKVS